MTFRMLLTTMQQFQRMIMPLAAGEHRSATCSGTDARHTRTSLPVTQSIAALSVSASAHKTAMSAGRRRGFAVSLF